LAYKWGLKTIYYSLINKVGAKAEMTNTNNGPILIANAADNVVLYEEDCESCKL